VKQTLQRAPEAIKKLITHSNSCNLTETKRDINVTKQPDPNGKTKCDFYSNFIIWII